MDAPFSEQVPPPTAPTAPIVPSAPVEKKYRVPLLLIGVSIFSILFGLSIGYVVGMNQSATIPSPTPSITPATSSLPTRAPTQTALTPTEIPVMPSVTISAAVTSVPDEGKPNIGSCTTHADCGGGCHRCQDSRCVNVCNDEP